MTGGNVVQLRSPRQAPADARMRFNLARKAAFAAFNDWLNEQPDPADVEEEIDATGNVLRQLRDLLLGVPK